MTASKLNRGESCLLDFLQIQSSPFSAAFMPKSLDRRHMQRRPAVSDSCDPPLASSSMASLLDLARCSIS